jgi:hypothetical protein
MPSKMKKTPGNRHSSKTPDQIMALEPGMIRTDLLEEWIHVSIRHDAILPRGGLTDAMIPINLYLLVSI